jgi:hypothetical protein
VELLQNIFNKVVFRNMDDVFVNSQQPPGISSRIACDIVINHLASGSLLPKILCFVEVKLAKNTGDYSLNTMETEALDYCEEYLKANPDIKFVHSCTAYGARLKLWKYSKGDEKMIGC